MIEFAVLAALALVVAIYLAFPRGEEPAVEPADVAALRARRAVLLHELRELNDDLAAGRIADADRLAARRALGPELRAVTEALRMHDDGGVPA